MSYLSLNLKVMKKFLLLLRLCLAEGFRRGRHEFQMSLLFGKFYNEGNMRLQCVTPNNLSLIFLNILLHQLGVLWMKNFKNTKGRKLVNWPFIFCCLRFLLIPSPHFPCIFTCIVASASCFQLEWFGKLEMQMRILQGRRPIKVSKMTQFHTQMQM